MKKAIIIIVVIVIILFPDKKTDNKNDVNRSTNNSSEITYTPTPTPSNNSNDSFPLTVFSSNDKQTTITSTPTNSPTPKPTKTPTPKPTSTPTPKPQYYTGTLDEYEKDYHVYYVANNNTKKFHTKYCRYIKQMDEANKYFATSHGFADDDSARSWLTKNGYVPCKVCDP